MHGPGERLGIPGRGAGGLRARFLEAWKMLGRVREPDQMTKSLGKLPIKNLGTSEGCEYVTRLHFASGQSSATWDHESA